MRREIPALCVLLTFFVLARSAPAQPYYARGSFYAGTTGVWNYDEGNRLYDDGMHGDGLAGDGVYAATVICDQSPGIYEFKIANAEWSQSWPHHSTYVISNARLLTTMPAEAVTFRLDTNPRPGWSPESGAVMTDHAMPSGAYLELMGSVPELGSWTVPVPVVLDGSVSSAEVVLMTAGPVEYKFRSAGTWDWPFGIHYNMLLGDNFVFLNPEPGNRVVFKFDAADGRSTVEIATPAESITWGGLKRLRR